MDTAWWGRATGKRAYYWDNWHVCGVEGKGRGGTAAPEHWNPNDPGGVRWREDSV